MTRSDKSLQPVGVISWRSQRCHQMVAPTDPFASRIVIADAGNILDPAWLNRPRVCGVFIDAPASLTGDLSLALGPRMC